MKGISFYHIRYLPFWVDKSIFETRKSDIVSRLDDIKSNVSRNDGITLLILKLFLHVIWLFGGIGENSRGFGMTFSRPKSRSE